MLIISRGSKLLLMSFIFEKNFHLQKENCFVCFDLNLIMIRFDVSISPLKNMFNYPTQCLGRIQSFRIMSHYCCSLLILVHCIEQSRTNLYQRYIGRNIRQKAHSQENDRSIPIPKASLHLLNFDEAKRGREMRHEMSRDEI